MSFVVICGFMGFVAACVEGLFLSSFVYFVIAIVEKHQEWK